MKVFIILLISTMFLGCTIQKPKFISCTSQTWSVNEGNSKGTVYHIVIKASADTTKLKFNSLKIADRMINDFKTSVLGQSNTSTYYKAKDSVLISFNLIGVIDTSDNFKKNENIIYYTFNSKSKHLSLKSIKAIKSQ